MASNHLAFHKSWIDWNQVLKYDVFWQLFLIKNQKPGVSCYSDAEPALLVPQSDPGWTPPAIRAPS